MIRLTQHKTARYGGSNFVYMGCLTEIPTLGVRNFWSDPRSRLSRPCVGAAKPTLTVGSPTKASEQSGAIKQ